MDLIDLIGFIIILLALILPLLRAKFAERARKRDPEREAQLRREREEQAREIIRSFFGEAGEAEEPPPDEAEEEELPHEEESRRVTPAQRHLPTFSTSIESRGEVAQIQGASFETEIGTTSVVTEAMQREADLSYAFRGEGSSSIANLIYQKGAMRQMLLLSEIYSPPLAMRDDEEGFATP